LLLHFLLIHLPFLLIRICLKVSIVFSLIFVYTELIEPFSRYL